MELLAPLLVLAGLGAVFAVMLRPPSSGAVARSRRVGLDRRRSDREPRLPLFVVVAVALAYLVSAGDGSDPATLVVSGLVVGAALMVRPLEPLVAALVGVAALLTAVVQLATGTGCAALLTGAGQIAVGVGAAAVLMALAGARLLLAPLRPRGAQARGAFLAAYAVVEGAVFAGRLVAQNALQLDAAAVGTALVLLAVIVLGLAVQPVFTSACVALAVAVGDSTVEAVSGCLSAESVVPLAVGMAVAYGARALLNRG